MSRKYPGAPRRTLLFLARITPDAIDRAVILADQIVHHLRVMHATRMHETA